MEIKCPGSIVLYAETLLSVSNTTEHDLDLEQDAFNANPHQHSSIVDNVSLQLAI